MKSDLQGMIIGGVLKKLYNFKITADEYDKVSI